MKTKAITKLSAAVGVLLAVAIGGALLDAVFAKAKVKHGHLKMESVREGTDAELLLRPSVEDTLGWNSYSAGGISCDVHTSMTANSAIEMEPKNGWTKLGRLFSEGSSQDRDLTLELKDTNYEGLRQMLWNFFKLRPVAEITPPIVRTTCKIGVIVHLFGVVPVTFTLTPTTSVELASSAVRFPSSFEKSPDVKLEDNALSLDVEFSFAHGMDLPAEMDSLAVHIPDAEIMIPSNVTGWTLGHTNVTLVLTNDDVRFHGKFSFDGMCQAVKGTHLHERCPLVNADAFSQLYEQMQQGKLKLEAFNLPTNKGNFLYKLLGPHHWFSGEVLRGVSWPPKPRELMRQNRNRKLLQAPEELFKVNAFTNDTDVMSVVNCLKLDANSLYWTLNCQKIENGFLMSHFSLIDKDEEGVVEFSSATVWSTEGDYFAKTNTNLTLGPSIKISLEAFVSDKDKQAALNCDVFDVSEGTSEEMMKARVSGSWKPRQGETGIANYIGYLRFGEEQPVYNSTGQMVWLEKDFTMKMTMAEHVGNNTMAVSAEGQYQFENLLDMAVAIRNATLMADNEEQLSMFGDIAVDMKDWDQPAKAKVGMTLLEQKGEQREQMFRIDMTTGTKFEGNSTRMSSLLGIYGEEDELKLLVEADEIFTMDNGDQPRRNEMNVSVRDHTSRYENKTFTMHHSLVDSMGDERGSMALKSKVNMTTTEQPSYWYPEGFRRTDPFLEMYMSGKYDGGNWKMVAGWLDQNEEEFMKMNMSIAAAEIFERPGPVVASLLLGVANGETVDDLKVVDLQVKVDMTGSYDAEWSAEMKDSYLMSSLPSNICAERVVLGEWYDHPNFRRYNDCGSLWTVNMTGNLVAMPAASDVSDSNLTAGVRLTISDHLEDVLVNLQHGWNTGWWNNTVSLKSDPRSTENRKVIIRAPKSYCNSTGCETKGSSATESRPPAPWWLELIFPYDVVRYDVEVDQFLPLLDKDKIVGTDKYNVSGRVIEYVELHLDVSDDPSIKNRKPFKIGVRGTWNNQSDGSGAYLAMHQDWKSGCNAKEECDYDFGMNGNFSYLNVAKTWDFDWELLEPKNNESSNTLKAVGTGTFDESGNWGDMFQINVDSLKIGRQVDGFDTMKGALLYDAVESSKPHNVFFRLSWDDWKSKPVLNASEQVRWLMDDDTWFLELSSALEIGDESVYNGTIAVNETLENILLSSQLSTNDEEQVRFMFQGARSLGSDTLEGYKTRLYVQEELVFQIRASMALADGGLGGSGKPRAKKTQYKFIVSSANSMLVNFGNEFINTGNAEAELTFSVSPALPENSGFSFNAATGVLSGTASKADEAAGEYTFQVCAADSWSISNPCPEVTLEIGSSVSIISGTQPMATAGAGRMVVVSVVALLMAVLA